MVMGWGGSRVEEVLGVALKDKVSVEEALGVALKDKVQSPLGWVGLLGPSGLHSDSFLSLQHRQSGNSAPVLSALQISPIRNSLC